MNGTGVCLESPGRGEVTSHVGVSVQCVHDPESSFSGHGSS